VENTVADLDAKGFCQLVYVKSTSLPSEYRLAGLPSIKSLLQFLDARTLQAKLVEMVQRLNAQVFGRVKPELIRCGYRLPALAAGGNGDSDGNQDDDEEDGQTSAEAASAPSYYEDSDGGNADSRKPAARSGGGSRSGTLSADSPAW
jgi:hypothetical protein